MKNQTSKIMMHTSFPVVPNNPTNPHENVYHPCQSQQKHHYTKVVIFESPPCLPRYLVELQSNFIQTPVNTPGEIEYQKGNKLLFLNHLHAYQDT